MGLDQIRPGEPAALPIGRKRNHQLDLRGYSYIAAAAVLWGVVGPFSRLAFSEGIGPMEVAFWRAALAWIFFGTHAVLTKSVRIRMRDIPMVVLFALAGITLFYSVYQLAIQAGGAALASVLLYTAPAWVTVMARFAFNEALSPVKLTALGLTLAGVICVAGGGGSIAVSWPAILYGLAAGFSYSLYYIFGKFFSSKYSSPNLFFYLLPIGALTLTPWVEFSPKGPVAWTALVCIALLSTYGAYFFYYQGLKYLEASRAAITATLEPVVAAVVAFIWWHESFGVLGYVGSTAILAAVVIMVLDGSSK
jgi:DME family drug/metabolite transporter